MICVKSDLLLMEEILHQLISSLALSGRLSRPVTRGEYGEYMEGPAPLTEAKTPWRLPSRNHRPSPKLKGGRGPRRFSGNINWQLLNLHLVAQDLLSREKYGHLFAHLLIIKHHHGNSQPSFLGVSYPYIVGLKPSFFMGVGVPRAASKWSTSFGQSI